MQDDPNERPRRRTVPVRRRAVVAAGGLAAAAAAAGGAALTGSRSAGAPRGAASPPAAPGGTPDERDVAAVLARRAAAVRDRDRIAFLATVAAAPADVRRAQLQMFDNLAALPLEGWRERYAAAEPAGADGAAAVRVTLGYRFRGYDAGTVARTRRLAFARRGGAWVIVGTGPGDDPEIWDGGALRVVRGRSCLVAGDAAGLAEIARRLDAAVPKVTAVTGRDWARRAVALAPASPAIAQALAGPGQDLAQIAALATVAPGPPGSRGEDRIVISPATFARLNDLGRTVVLTHELTHVATGGARDGRTPLWLIEGFADYVGYRGTGVAAPAAAAELAAEVRAGRVPAELPDRAAFDGATGRLAQSYQEAWLACRMIAGRYGEAALVRLYRAAGRTSESAALRAVLGAGPAALTAAWRDYLRKELR
ncbi:basic secretory family protein [Actinomadura parmotrematis]|uniref:Basic secretory family protein n=1 Tax=Actinomadura parmotrematis TaxID=2864039 RepID=A0ABS7FKG2_9ACTN|nr:basic secretory family protein [Actinomadura parmotrematis]MBW8480844.1 basic secretory family protein [Actinomadura parmotrematis]